jgi:DNA-binding NtrC family response regulator
MSPDGHGNVVKVACVDDDPRIVRTVAAIIKQMGCSVDTYTDPQECWLALEQHPVDIVLTDLDMPQVDGITLMKRIRTKWPETDVIIITGNADKTVAIQALRLGAFDFFEKPLNRDELIETVKRTMRYRDVVRERDGYAEQVSFLSSQQAKRWGINAFVGKSPSIRCVVSEIRKLHRASNTAVLVTGESGTGKELVARAIHYGGARASRPFVPVNCSAIPRELVESTLFGHVRGAFTGAVGDKKGAFVLADGGTLFMDEIGDMPAEMQVKLLRVLEDGVVVPVGGAREQQVDVRVVAATNADLQQRIADGSFRSDLFFRIAGYTMELPPLRDRTDDIPLLARHFSETLSAEMGIPVPGFSDAAMALLMTHPFPGNIRELKNLVERALIECEGAVIEAEHLRFVAGARVANNASTAPVGGANPGVSSHAEGIGSELPSNLQAAEKLLISRAMTDADGNVSAAARILGINRTKLYRKLVASGDALPEAPPSLAQ